MRITKLAAIPVFLAATFFLSAEVQARDDVLKLYTAHEFDKVITEAKDAKDAASRIALALSYTEKYAVYKNKADRDQAKMYIKLLEVDLGIKDAKTVEKFLNIEGNPNGNKVAADLLEKCFENAQCTPGDIMLVIPFISPAKGADVAEMAIYAVRKRLDNVREYVGNGAVMPKEMQELFQKRELIEPLVAALGEKDTASAARKCLVVIEEPALKYLEDKPPTPALADAIVDIKKAIAKRKARFQNSTWYSAAGK